MAISSITSPPNIHAASVSPTLVSHQTDCYYFDHRPLVSTSTPLPECGDKHLQKKKNVRFYESSSHPGSSGDENSASTTGPLSLQERRIRNKTASAKYRAKKNQQYYEMRSMILSLTKENDVLSRQFEQMKSENRHLKSECDKLRSKMIATRMLKKMLDDQQRKNKCGPLECVSMEMDDGAREDSDHDDHYLI
ncbi:hypothetical protein [Absidia glauca]|uniref:BZIP domain-containing protein n=1 Tax=Absidia glauca TaxID=4829 RepID=A0A163KAP4_ABSGL|nr:hypothetical protein [Absidia glauca]